MADKFQTKKSLGQHFLNSPVVSGWMCDAANITTGETILEIGPGTGALTKELLSRGAQVIALEADARAIAVLEENFSAELKSGRLTLMHTDVRTLLPQSIQHLTDHSFKLVANIPYYLSGLLFRMFLESSLQPTQIVYLVQREVAKRITTELSRGEKESLLSLAVKAYGTPVYVRTVPRGHFTPPPKVDSAIISINNISRNNFTELDEKEFFRLLHLGFGQKRKQLVCNLAAEFPRETVLHALSTLNLLATVRAEDVGIEAWLKLATLLLSTRST